MRNTNETETRSCSNCKHRRYHSWSGIDYCLWYEMHTTEREYIKEASDCGKYEMETNEDREEFDEYYTPSSTAGDYSPSNPWNAPGMSVRDFI